MKTRGSYILYLLILCVVVGCKGTSSPSTASETDEYAGTCEGEKAKAILWVDYKRGRKITDGTPIRTVKVYADVHADGSLKVVKKAADEGRKLLIEKSGSLPDQERNIRRGISETGGTVFAVTLSAGRGEIICCRKH